MKHTALMIAAAMSIHGVAAAAAPQQRDVEEDNPRYYIGLNGGANQLKEWPATVRLGGPVSADGAAHLKSGYAAGIQIGRQKKNSRIELEYQQGGFKLKGLELGPVTESVAGDAGRYQALTLNGYRTGELSENWTGYAGLGIGWGRVELPGAGFSGGCNCFPKAAGNSLVLLARLGTEYRFDDNGKHRAFLQYTWLGMRGPSYPGSPGIDYDRKIFGSLTIGYRYVFD